LKGTLTSQIAFVDPSRYSQKQLEVIIRETGRAGRDEGRGNVSRLLSDKDIEKLKNSFRKAQLQTQEIGRQLIIGNVSYAETAVCRRKQLYNYSVRNIQMKTVGVVNNRLNPKRK